MAKSIKKNFIYNLIYQIVMLVSPLALTPYISRVLGPDGVGLYSYADSMARYFIIFAILGTTTFGQRAISYVQEEKEARSRAFWEIFLLRAMTSVVTLGFYIGYTFLFARENLIITLLLSLNILNVAFDISWFFQGMEEFGKTVLRNILFRLACIIATFIFVREADDLILYVIFITASGALGSLSLWLYMPKYLVKVGGLNPFRDIRSIFFLFVPTIAVQIYTVLDKSMIGWFSDGYNENGYYEQAEKVIKLALTVITALGIVMIPRIASTYKSGDMERVRYYIYNSYRYVWMMAIPIMFGLLSIADVFTPVYYGAGYDKCAILLPILSLLSIFIGLSNVNGMQYFVPIGKENILTLTVIVGAVINFVFNLIFIPLWASVGACIASAIAEFFVTLTGFIYIWKTKQFPIRPVFTCSWRYWVAGIVMGGALFGLKYCMPTALWSLIVLIASGAAIYFVMLLILRDPFLFDLIKKGIGLFRRNKQPAPAEGPADAAEPSATAEDSTPSEDSAAEEPAPAGE